MEDESPFFIAAVTGLSGRRPGRKMISKPEGIHIIIDRVWEGKTQQDLI